MVVNVLFFGERENNIDFFVLDMFFSPLDACAQVMFSRKVRAKGGKPDAPGSLSTVDKAVHTYVNGELQPQVRYYCVAYSTPRLLVSLHVSHRSRCCVEENICVLYLLIGIRAPW